jgi:hypothetical protein
MRIEVGTKGQPPELTLPGRKPGEPGVLQAARRRARGRMSRERSMWEEFMGWGRGRC